ncbi:MAG TPA: rhombosortase [Steroidobacteraceae bacterium]|nr:rhombosortase [Steroidobacteraceae bacterium]
MNRVSGGLESLNCDGRRGLTLVGVCVALLLPTLWGDAARLALRYDRTALAAGQFWRLLSAHVVHLNLRHALVNVLGLALLWALFARDYCARQWLVIVAACVLAIDAGLWLLDSTVQWYVGSSGVLHGILAAGTLAQLRRGHPEGWVLALLLAGKLLYEHFAGPLPFSGSAPVIVSAHVFGVLGGAAAALALRIKPLPL